MYQSYGRSEKNNVVTGRNLLMKRMRMFATKTGDKIDSSIYIENKMMEELMKSEFSAGDLVPIFKDLERGNSILICNPQLERDTEK